MAAVVLAVSQNHRMSSPRDPLIPSGVNERMKTGVDAALLPGVSQAVNGEQQNSSVLCIGPGPSDIPSAAL